jgi:chromosome segregation ATPase
MANEEVQEQNYDQQNYVENPNTKIKDLEEKQNILRERLLLIGKNLVEVKEEANEKTLDMKRELENLNQEIQRMKSFLESVSTQISKFAKKEDLEILAKQMKMFQPFIKNSVGIN